MKGKAEAMLARLRAILQPVGWRVDVDPISLHDPKSEVVRFDFRLPLAGPERKVMGWCSTISKLEFRMNNLSVEDWSTILARDVMGQMFDFLVVEATPLPPAPDPPDWRPAETIPEDFYAK